jgi:hypothetical protein
VITDATTPATDLTAAHPDLVLVRATDARLLQVLGGSESRHINLADRRGLLVFRYPDDPEPKAFIRELGKLINFDCRVAPPSYRNSVTPRADPSSSAWP